MARVAKDKKTTVTKRKDAKYPGETLLEVSFGAGTQAYQGCLISVRVQEDGTPILDVYRSDEKIGVFTSKQSLRNGGVVIGETVFNLDDPPVSNDLLEPKE